MVDRTMKKLVPRNDVSIDYCLVLDSFIDLIKQKQNNNIKSVFLTGSYTRGDARDTSDLDVWCVFDYINSKVLSDVGNCARELYISYNQIEVNSQCLSMDEVKSDYFSNWTEKSIKILDGVLLHGEDIFGENPSISELKLIYSKYLADVLMSIRHYICVDKPLEKLTYKKITTNILKPLMFPLRLERYCTCGQYPESNYDLLKSYDSRQKE